MRTLLVYPRCLEERLHAEDARVVPMGVYFVAAALKTAGHPVEILNGYEMDRDPKKTAEMLARKRPEVIGFSILSANRWGALDMARLAKQVDPQVNIVFGGIGATCLWRHFLTHFPEVDFVVLGEGEHTLPRLIHALQSGDESAVRHIRGLAFRKDGRPVRNPPRPPVQDLDSLPNPARYFDYRHLALTRGCPGRCTFCGSPGFWGKTVRFHSAECFVDQLEMLCDRGTRFFFFSDDTFTLDRGRVRDVCRMILQRGLEISWAAISRVDTVDEETLMWMRRAGCIQISYGVESGSEKIRRGLAKRISGDQIRKAFALTTRFGILARAYFIYGCPGESRATIQETLDLMDAIAPLGAVFYILDLFPGTALYEAYRKKHRVSDDVWLDRKEDILYFETDPALTRQQVFDFGRTLRRHFHNNLSRYVEAVELIDLPELYPLHADFCSRLAMTFDHGDYAHVADIPDKAAVAERLYRKALDYHPDARAYLGLGILAQKRRAYPQSVDILTQGVDRFPDHPQLNICLAVSHMNMGAFRQAMARLIGFESSKEACGFIAACRQALGEP